MADYKAANVTKYDNGGSGDNVISDGYIKSVEKVWIDSYTITSLLSSSDSILIGYVPKGKKLIDVQVYLPQVSTLATTFGTVELCTGSTVAAGLLGVMRSDNWTTVTHSLSTASMLRLAPTKMLTTLKTDADTGLYITIHPTTGSCNVSGGTIRSIIKYT